jgi:hypothetical protein
LRPQGIAKGSVARAVILNGEKTDA